MATDKELQNQKNLNKEKAQTNNLDSQNNQYAQEASRAAQARVDFARSLTEELKDQLNIRSRNNETDRAQLNLSRQVAASAAENNVLLGNSQQIGRQILKDEKLLSNIIREKEGLIASIGGENSKGYEIAQKVANLQKKQYDQLDKINDLQNKVSSAKGKEREDLEKQLKNAKSYSKSLDTQLANRVKDAESTGALGKKEIDRLAVLELMEENQLETLRGRREEAEIQSKINDKMGVTGALVEGVGGIMQRLGMRSGIFSEAMSSAQAEMQKLSESGVRTRKVFNEITGEMEEVTEKVTKLDTMFAGLTEIGKGFGKALKDPATLVAGIAQGFFDVNKAAVEAARYTGEYNSGLQGGFNRLASTKDILETTVELTKELGMSANAVFSPDMLANAAELKNTMGLAGKEMAGMILIAKTTGQSIDQVVDSTVEQVNAFNAANRSAVNHRMVLEDVGNASDSIRASVSMLPGGLAKAAASARRLGMSLSDVDSIASSLLDFESSIEAELEAQLLTGKSINMAKARELALNNDLAGLGKELFKNASDINEFGKMNRIQQEAQAKALGMTRDQLAKVAYQRALEAGMTDDQAAAAAGVNAEEMKRMAIQDKIAKAIERLQQAFAPVLDVVVSIVDALTPILTVVGGLVGGIVKVASSLGLIQAAVIGIAAVKTVDFFNSDAVKGFIAATKTAITTTRTYITSLKTSNAYKKLSALFTTQQTAAENLNTAAKAKGNILERISIALGKTRLGQLVLEKAAILKSAAAKLFGANATAALNTQSKIAATTGAAGGAGMAAFAAGLAALSPVLPVILGLSLAIVGLGLALRLAAPAIVGVATVIGNVLMKALEMLPSIIDSIAAGFTMILSQLTLEKAAALVVMGAGFAAIGLGLSVLSASLFTAIPGLVMLGAIAALGPGLSLAGQGVKLIADNVSKLSEALQTLNLENLDRLEEFMTKSAFTMPVIAAAGPAAASAISTIAGTGGAGEEDNKVAAKIQELIDLVASGQIVELKLDSDTISRNQMISLSKGK